MPQNILELFRRRATKGEVGIEIEMEGSDLKNGLNDLRWAAHRDGSLRGESIEYVLNRPVSRDKITEVLNSLQEELDSFGSKLKPSNRCGVHVHINVQNMTMTQVISFFTLYIIFEDLLVKTCGEEREGNLFCLRARDAEFIVDGFAEIIKYEHYSDLDDRFRYASINLSALRKFGSLEFRAMRTDADFTHIATWAQILLRIKDMSLQFEQARDIISGLSAAGPRQFFERIMGEYVEILECPNMEDLLYEGVRRVQIVAYAKEGENRNKREERFKPPVWGNFDDRVEQVRVDERVRLRAGHVAEPLPRPMYIPEEINELLDDLEPEDDDEEFYDED